MGFNIGIDPTSTAIPAALLQELAGRAAEATSAPSGPQHVRLEPDTTLACLHCGERYRVNVPVPMSLLLAMMKQWTENHAGCPVDPAIVANEQECWEVQFRDPGRWISGTDRGLSSMTIWYAIMNGLPYVEASLPRDPGDFGRCLRLVDAFAWTARLGEVVALHPDWKVLVDRWDEVAALFREEVPQYRQYGHEGTAPRTFALMKAMGL